MGYRIGGLAMKIQDLTDAQLDKWVAMAQDLTPKPAYVEHGKDLRFIDGETWSVGKVVYDYHPTSNDAQAMGLKLRFKLGDSLRISDPSYHVVFSALDPQLKVLGESINLNRAICLAVVASVYGDEVEEVE